jgi:hypothetical protein
MSGTLTLIICTDDVILFGKNINIVTETTEALLSSSTEAGLDVNAKKLSLFLYICL